MLIEQFIFFYEILYILSSKFKNYLEYNLPKSLLDKYNDCINFLALLL